MEEQECGTGLFGRLLGGGDASMDPCAAGSGEMHRTTGGERCLEVDRGEIDLYFQCIQLLEALIPEVIKVGGLGGGGRVFDEFVEWFI